METARPARTRRRPRRGSVERPIDTRLVRNVALLLVGPLVILVLTVSRTGSLPAPDLPPAFDGATALELTRELAHDHPDRVPGSPGAAAAARWLESKLQLYGIPVEEDVWTQSVPGLGKVELRNLSGVVQGTLDSTIVVVAHRDNRSGSSGADDNASGTAALVELARAYANVGTGDVAPRRPLHTIVFLSTDAGAYGDAGAARFARSALGRRAVAALVLDGLAGRTRPHVVVSGLEHRSPGSALYRTLLQRLADQGTTVARPPLLEQLVALGIPLALGEQGPLLGAGIPAVRVGTAPETAPPPGSDEVESLDAQGLARLGRGVDATLGSLDGAVQLADTTRGVVFLDQRAVRGWALELLLLTALVPFAVGSLDLLARCRRRGTPLAGGWRAYRRRLGFWLLGLVALGLVALTGALPVATELPPRPDLPPLDRWPVAGIGVLALAGLVAWLRERALLVPRGGTDPEEELAGWAVAFLALLGVAVLVALVSPYTLLFVVPSLYAWLGAVQAGRDRRWLADGLFGLGLLGPLVAVVVVGRQLSLGLEAPLYAVALLTSGTVPWLVGIALAAWTAAAAQIAALVAGRYAPLDDSPSRR